MGVVKASPPVGRSVRKLLFGYEMPAITTLELFLVDLVVAGFSEIGKLLLHWISSKSVRVNCCYGGGVLSTLE